MIPPNIRRSAVLAKLAERHLADFVRYMWDQVEPATPLIWGWYLDAICDHLEAVSRGDIKYLLINIPPRHLKSTIVSVMWPAWDWLKHPHRRYLTSSYRMDLATRDAVRSRRVMLSPKYQAMLRKPDGSQPWAFMGDQNVKSRYENTVHGHRICTAVAAGATGEGGDIVTVDDPHNVRPQESSAAQRKEACDWWDQTMSTRRNTKNAARVIIMQRVADDDLSAHVLGKGGIEHLCLTTMFESDHPTPSVTSLGFEDPRTEDGEMLAEQRFGPEEIAEAQRDLGTWGFVGQHQQRPSPASGGIFKRAWFRYWTTLPPKFDRIIQSWDLAFKGKTEKQAIAKVMDPSYVVGQVWGFVGANAYLLDEVRGQWDFKRSIVSVLALTDRWPKATKKLIEAKANGPALVSLLRDDIPGLVEVEVKAGKIERAIGVAPVVESGNVYLPHPDIHPWIDRSENPKDRSWLDEVCSFPNAKHNDRVDTMTQALMEMQKGGTAAAIERLKKLGRM